MWNILTQKELLLTLDMNRQAEVRETLSLHGIDYESTQEIFRVQAL